MSYNNNNVGKQIKWYVNETTYGGGNPKLLKYIPYKNYFIVTKFL